MRVYYLDDEPDLLEMFAETFSTPDVSIETFSSPQVALEVIRRCPPDLLFLDHRLPGTTGEAVAMQVSPLIPKALVTGDVNLKTTFSFDAVFGKPLDVEQIDAFIRSHVGKAVS